MRENREKNRIWMSFMQEEDERIHGSRFFARR
jgi:hypothetical protein